MSNMNSSQYNERVDKLKVDCQTLFSLLGFTLVNIDDLIAKHHKNIAREKTKLLISLCLFAATVSTHFRKTIDESKFNIHYISDPEDKPGIREVVPVD